MPQNAHTPPFNPANLSIPRDEKDATIPRDLITWKIRKQLRARECRRSMNRMGFCNGPVVNPDLLDPVAGFMLLSAVAAKGAA